MPVNNLGFHGPISILRPRWVTNLCILLWALAHIFGILSFAFLMGALYEEAAPAGPGNNSSSSQTLGSGITIRVYDAATHNSLTWGLAAGMVSILLVISGCGLWRLKKWGFIPLGLLILASLPGILTWAGFEINLFR